MSPVSDHDVERWVRSIAGHGVTTARGAPFPVPEERFGQFYLRVRSERLDGLLLQAWRDGAIELTAQQAEMSARTHRQEMERVLRLERTALDVTGSLADHGITSVLLKGVALANTVYDDAAQRSFGDVDVLVEPAQFVAAIGVLLAAGARRDLPEVRPGFDARFAKDVPLLLDGMTVDLHRTLIQGPFGVHIPVADVVTASRPIELGGRTVRVLDPADAYLFAALTAGAADVPARLVTLRDLLQLERAPTFDAAAVRGAAIRWGVEAPLARAVLTLAERLGPDTPPCLLAWAAAYRPDRLDRAFMSCYLSSARSYRSTLATLVAVPHWSDRFRLIRALLLPQAAYRQARGWSRRHHLGLAVAKLRR
jgi:hypothetical protein